MRNVNDKNAQLQKQLENVVREGYRLTLRLCFLSNWFPFLQPTERLTSLATRYLVGRFTTEKTSYRPAYLILTFDKYEEFERDLELERRKVRDLQDASRERDKEYQKLKVRFSVA